MNNNRVTLSFREPVYPVLEFTRATVASLPIPKEVMQHLDFEDLDEIRALLHTWYERDFLDILSHTLHSYCVGKGWDWKTDPDTQEQYVTQRLGGQE